MIAPAESRTVIVALAPAVPVTAAPSGETLATGVAGYVRAVVALLAQGDVSLSP